MQRLNLHEAKTHMARLVAQAVAGEGFVICKAGVPLVQVTRLADGESLDTPPRRGFPPCGICWRIRSTPSASASPPSGSW